MWKIIFVMVCGSSGFSIAHSASIVVNDSASLDQTQKSKSDVLLCPQNEEYAVCSNALCRAQICEERTLSVPCPSVTMCVKSCVCSFRYLRNTKGICVKEEQCDVGPRCPENQVYSKCSNAICRHQECSQRSKPIYCPSVHYPCLPGCVCDEGYLRNHNGNCIKEEQCD